MGCDGCGTCGNDPLEIVGEIETLSVRLPLLTLDLGTGFRLFQRRAAMRIGEIAKASGVNIETIRYYEREALVAKPKRTHSGYREFSPDAVQDVRFIKRAQDLGFTLREVRELMDIYGRP